MSFTSSDYTTRLRQRYLYAAKIMQQTALSNGQQIYVQLDGTQKGAIQYTDAYIDYTSGENITTLAEQQLYINNTAPTNAPSVPSITTPDAPTDLSVSAGVNILTVSFTPPISDGGSDITNYFYSVNGGTSFTAFNPVDTSSPVTITGLTANTSYSVALKASNAAGLGTASSNVTASTGTGPNAPVLTAALADDSSAWIYFNSPTGASESNYQYSIDGTTYTTLNPADIISPIEVPGLTNGTPYTITLQTMAVSGTSDPSNSISVTPASFTSATPWLYFDPSNSSSYPGSGSTLSNIGSYGTLTGTITSATYNGSVKGGILDFNGFSYVSFGRVDFGTTMTITAWIYPRSTTTINGLLTNVGANQAPSGFKFGWNWWQQDSRALLLEAGNGTQGSAPSSVRDLITYNQWQHVAYVFDKTNRIILFFLNGVPVDMNSSVTTVANIGTNNAAFRIGTFTDGSYGMNAQLGYLKVYNSLLDATQINRDYTDSQSRFA